MSTPLHWTDRLSEYLDEELSADARTACERHLAECHECRDAVNDLRAVIALARRDEPRLPTTNLWPQIGERIGAGGGGRRPRTVVLTWPQLGLAASLLIAVSSSAAYLAAGRQGANPVALEPPIRAQAEPLLSSVGVDRANFADAAFDRAVADLERVLVERRDVLDPRTVVVIERNLTTVDEAIREARAALDADPGNTFLNTHLADARRKKLDLLRQATMLQAPTGD